jgi:hypothetical protein
MFSTRRSILALSAGALALAAGAHAAPPKAEAVSAEQAASEKEIARSIELGGLVFPVFDKDNKLRNYLFVNARMLVADGKDPWKYREQSHFIRDAVIRAAHRTSFHLAADMSKLDEKRAAAESLKAANAVLGEPGAVVSMTFTQIASQSGR